MSFHRVLGEILADFAARDFFDGSHLEFRCAQKSSQNRTKNFRPRADRFRPCPCPGAASRSPGGARRSACVATASEGQHAQRVYTLGGGAERNCRCAGARSEGAVVRRRFRSFPRTLHSQRYAESAAARTQHALRRREIGGELCSHPPGIFRASAFFERAVLLQQ